MADQGQLDIELQINKAIEYVENKSSSLVLILIPENINPATLEVMSYLRG